MPKVCSNCGESLKEDLDFCVNCGAALEVYGSKKNQIQLEPKESKKKGLKKKYLVIFIFALILATIGIGYIFSRSTLSIQSSPSGSEVYLDSEFKGTTPCVIPFVIPGIHQIEFRHEKYPPWKKTITLSLGQTENINADLSDNLIPNVILVCKSKLSTADATEKGLDLKGWSSDCIYAQNEEIQLSGIAVRPHPEQNPNVHLSIKNIDQNTLFSTKEYDVRIDEDFTYGNTISSNGFPSGNYQITATIPSGQTSIVDFTIESPADTNIRILKQLVEDYHKTHTYSLSDMFVCGDMATDVWNMVKTQGINAVIYVGNVDKDITTIQEANHVWVMAETSPNEWLALETTGGFIACNNQQICSVNNPRYYNGWKFNNPLELKDALDKLKHPCSDGYILGNDNLCHQSCGGNTYCTGNSVCINGQCRGCNPGYILGEDLQCHQPCGGGNTYCTGNSVCINGQCRGCSPGYYLGTDLRCYKA
jgi:hypothetical protein